MINSKLLRIMLYVLVIDHCVIKNIENDLPILNLIELK